MNLSKILPTGPQVSKEILIVLAGVLGAAFILSRFPKVSAWVAAQSITVKNDSGNILY